MSRRGATRTTARTTTSTWRNRISGSGEEAPDQLLANPANWRIHPKAQQDALLPHVEDGTVTLIGATTENPYFEVNAALLSRMRVWRLEPLTDEDVASILRCALEDAERGLAGMFGPRGGVAGRGSSGAGGSCCRAK